MDVTHLLDKLNDAQRLAVSGPLTPTLVLAGAGSGKTRVLTHRIAWLVEVENVTPYGILAVTFTNKAAGEMRGRIENMLAMPSAPLWVGTFHGIAHRLLRMHWREAKLPQTFQIIDAEDQQRMIRKLLKAMNLDESRWVPKEITWFINAQKDEGLRPAALRDEGDPMRRQMIKLYEAYQEQCERTGAVDFAELLLRAYELWRDNPDVLAHYRNRFRHVLIDEFQDTNAIQYRWFHILTGPEGVPFVVGDDDQSIYRWRGARVENLHQFTRDYPTTQTVRLEQNYRSTGNILAAANALIKNNTGRLGKNLWTSGAEGDPIKIYAAFNERDEADFVVNRIREWSQQGGNRSECAILYRSNAQSRAFEEAMIMARMPYRVYGGLRFFERAEIKDALGYLRLIHNRADDASFERIVNVPTRGIGAKTVDAVRDYARANACTMWQAAGACIADLGPKSGTSLHAFLVMIEQLERDTRDLPLHEQADHVIARSGLIAHYEKEKGDKGEARVENLEELVSAARGFSTEETGDLSPLAAFLSHAVLESGEGQADAGEDCVQLMTLHTAKGLEFPVVFLAGMEDGLFPHQRSAKDPAGLEEERRLCYVGTTRAMKQLYLSYAEQRRMHGVDSYGSPSRFIREIPSELVEEVRPRIQVSRPVYTRPRPAIEDDVSIGVRLGQRVRHPTFGDGVVINIEGQGTNARVEVNFERVGKKLLIYAAARLEPI
ncbi:MAG TPA: DNA helicase II [Steroidobacteraceae bacterium]|nr:DNA helicase II [Steroidobacteraceae bacterium]